MMKSWAYAMLVLAVLHVSSSLAQQPRINEDELVAHLQASLVNGRLVWLDVNGQKLFGILNDDVTGTMAGGAILLHDINTHPDWPQVIAPLRTTLPQRSWATLSIHIPGLINQASSTPSPQLLQTTPAIISSGINYLKEKSIENIVLIGYGTGAALATAFLANTPNSGVTAFIGISMIVNKDWDPMLFIPTHLERITLPILDIYGERDLDAVTTTAGTRLTAAKKSGSNASQQQRLESPRRSGFTRSPFADEPGFIAFRQIVIPGADHDFSGVNDALAQRIIGWLRRHASGVGISTNPKPSTKP